MVVELIPSQQAVLPPEDQALVKGGGPLLGDGKLHCLHGGHRLRGEVGLPLVFPVVGQDGHQLGQIRRADGQAARVVRGPHPGLCGDLLSGLLLPGALYHACGAVQSGHLLRLQPAGVEGGPHPHGLEKADLQIVVQQLPGG